eukprot:12414159-Karenia_brevis.AAC.1
MDRKLGTLNTLLASKIQSQDTTGHMRIWSEAVEESVAEYIGADQELRRKLKGRGAVRIRKHCKKGTCDVGPQSQPISRALPNSVRRCQKQAGRCNAWADRINAQARQDHESHTVQ